MTYHGRIRDGVVILDGNAKIPEGAKVRIEVMEEDCKNKAKSLTSLFRIAERAKPTGIPDLSINHDHYLYGHPKVNGE